jgi:hypothetical protein
MRVARKETRMTEKTQTEDQVEKEEKAPADQKKYDGGAIPSKKAKTD